MLVISCKRDEQIVIDGPAVITAVDIRGDKVRLGIEADPETTIMRGAIVERVPDMSRLRALVRRLCRRQPSAA